MCPRRGADVSRFGMPVVIPPAGTEEFTTRLGEGMRDIYGLFVVVGIIIAILWIVLPFAVFGIKKKLDLILAELKRINRDKEP